MKLIDPHVIPIVEKNPYKKIEFVGRTCYKSEDKITDDSYKSFLNMLIRNNHFAMIEHANQVFELTSDDKFSLHRYIYELSIEHEGNSQIINNKYLNLTIETLDSSTRILVSGNIRSIIQRNLNDPIYRSLVESYPLFRNESIDSRHPYYTLVNARCVDIDEIKDITQYEFLNHFYMTFKFVTDRGVTHELVRHRPFSFAQESTRYCNYSNGKFGGELTFARPSTFYDWSIEHREHFYQFLISCENNYMNFVNVGPTLQPQQARAILPNCLKSEIVVTGDAKEWKHFLDLRSRGVTGRPHPDMKLVADMCKSLIDQHIKSKNFKNNFEI